MLDLSSGWQAKRLAPHYVDFLGPMTSERKGALWDLTCRVTRGSTGSIHRLHLHFIMTASKLGNYVDQPRHRYIMTDEASQLVTHQEETVPSQKLY